MDIITHALIIGMGATAIMDLWLALLRRWGVPSLDYALVGRWIGHFPRAGHLGTRVARESDSSSGPHCQYRYARRSVSRHATGHGGRRRGVENTAPAGRAAA
jgi:hypothetical protein